MLYKSRVGAGGASIPYAKDEGQGSGNGVVSPGKRRGISRNNNNLPPQASDPSYDQSHDQPDAAQLQIFEEENSALLQHYNTQLNSLHAAEKSILEISELHNTLHANLQQQGEHIEQLVQDSYLTTENLGKGNK